MAEQTGSGDPRERVTAKRSAGVAALVAAGLAAGALAAGSLASGATADPGDPTTTTSTDPAATTTDTTTTDTTTTTTDTTTTDTTTTTTTDTTTTTTTTDPGAPPPDTTTVATTPVEPPPVVEPPAAPEPAAPPVAEPTPPEATAPVAPPAPETAPATPEPPADMGTGGGREQPPTHPGSGKAATVVPAASRPPRLRRRRPRYARLLPTPAQIRFYVHATSTPPLPKLRTIDHDLALRVSTIAAESHIHWALLAAVARVESRLGAGKGPIAGKRLSTVPAGEAEQLPRTRSVPARARRQPQPQRLRWTQDALKEYFGSEKTAKRVGALAAFYGALGLGRMQHGLGWHGGQLRKRVLHDRRLHIYPGGRADIRGRRVDPRVLITMEYLANSTGSVRVSSLVSGHRLFTAAGSVSAHVYGRAVDVTAVGGTRIKHHQGPGSVTERTVRLLLMLPQRMRPRQVVSMMDVDGPTGNRGSFALPDHSDRIQIGY